MNVNGWIYASYSIDINGSCYQRSLSLMPFEVLRLATDL
jgi:hypothetical protein